MCQEGGSDTKNQYSGKIQQSATGSSPLGEVGAARAGAVTKHLLSSYV